MIAFPFFVLLAFFVFVSLIAVAYGYKAYKGRLHSRFNDKDKDARSPPESSSPPHRVAKNEFDNEHKTQHNPIESNHPPDSEAENHVCNHEPGGRNLVLCIDGTANQFGEKNTNVIELYNLVVKGSKGNQQTWYNSGIGTYVRPSEYLISLAASQQYIYHTIDMAIAWNFKKTILLAYQWLSDNYQEGDCIFLFGFSRGAFQVRVLSAMIDKVGLIYKGNESQIPFAYELYADPASSKESDKEPVTRVGSNEKTSSASRFKKAFSYEGVKVHFVGAWDTVSSIGIVRGKYMLPGTVDGMHHVCYFRHALALDERRVKFLPEYAYGGITTSKQGGSEEQEEALKSPERGRNATTSAKPERPHTLEVWFAGTHSDIGGGNVENAGMDRSRPPLRWMVFEAGNAGLRTAAFERELNSEEQIEVKESLTGTWWLLEYLPLTRLTYRDPNDPKDSTYWPHCGEQRTIHHGQKIHSSLLLANKLKEGYTPKAYPVGDESFWQGVRKDGLGERLELDLYDYVDDRVTKFVGNLDNNLLKDLHQIGLWANGQQAVCESLYNAMIDSLKLDDAKYEVEKKCRLLNLCLDILRKSPLALKQTHYTQIRSAAQKLLTDVDPNHRNAVKTFLIQCTYFPQIDVLQGHSQPDIAIVLSPDGNSLVSGSADRKIYVWNAETGAQVGEPFRGHTHYVRSVAFSSDGKRVASGSDDHTIRLWDSETGRQIGEPFRGHSSSVWSIAISPNGMRLVSGSTDETICIWNLETGKRMHEPLTGHTGWVRNVAFSPDGSRIVSCSDDCTIRVWDMETGMQIGQPFEGHTEAVWSVALSSDGMRIVSGSGDQTIRIWDSGTGKQVGEPLRGHTAAVQSVAFSPSGGYIASGSWDQTVRIWDLKTGKQIGESFEGHEGDVYSVAFSPDGERIVSGSHDTTIRIWNVKMYLETA